MRLVILGAGGYGRTVADIAEQSGKYEKIVFLDDASPLAAGKCEDFPKFNDGSTEMYPAFGNNKARLAWINQLEMAGISVPTIVHSSAYVSPSASIDRGVVVMPKTVVNTDCKVERGCIVNCGALVDHGCILEEGVHVCLGAVIKAENRIPTCMKIEAGQVVENRTWPL